MSDVCSSSKHKQPSFLWRRVQAVVALVQKFQRGPEIQSDWNLVLWRVTFPMLTLVVLVFLIILGRFGQTAYLFGAGSVWYFSSSVLVVYPFDQLFDVSHTYTSFQSPGGLWRFLAWYSVGVAAVEWAFSAVNLHFSWIVGNTLFGAVSLLVLPLACASHVRQTIQRGRETRDAVTVPASALPSQPSDSVVASASSGRPRSKHEFVLLESSSPRNNQTRELSTSGSWLVSVSIISVLITWALMCLAYTSVSDAMSLYWLLVCVLAGFACVLVLCAHPTTRSKAVAVDHTIIYGTVLVHVPVYVGHLCLGLFTLADDSNDSYLKFAVSLLYLGLMQCYFYLVTRVVNAMAEPFSHPCLLYLTQLYYYLFWYLLVGTDTPMDGVYWAMVVLNNIHIALINTGVYADVRDSTLTLCAPTTLSHLTCGIATAACLNDTQRQKYLPTHGRVPVVHVQKGNDDASATEDEGGAEYDSGEELVKTLFGPRSPRHQASASKARASSLPVVQTEADVGEPAVGSEVITPPAVFSADRVAREHLGPLYFLMKLAEQDNMADTSALVLVPSLLTLQSAFRNPSAGFDVLFTEVNTWTRCICMFLGRQAGAYLAREIFAYKLRSRLRAKGNRAVGSLDSASIRPWIQRLMLQDFQHQFWYLVVVTIVVTFACFSRVDMPLRFALRT